MSFLPLDAAICVVVDEAWRDKSLVASMDVDSEGYSHFPNGDMLTHTLNRDAFSSWVQTKWAARTVNSNGRSMNTKNCLGIFRCSNCRVVYRPPQDTASIKKHLET